MHIYLINIICVSDGSTSSLSTTTAPGPSENLTLTKELLLQGPVIPMCIYLHSNVALMMEVEDTPTATTDLICQAIINCDELGLNKQVASNVFTLWMTSPLLGKPIIILCLYFKNQDINHVSEIRTF